ncbi:MAG TPA: FAD-dependent oxidoreductase [Planctomycetota bacterium]|nr:FAD-dependent oxidoreductase [Planctomycetota bacterium]
MAEAEATVSFKAADAPTLNLKDVERETLEVDVCIVGGGIAGLSTAYHLAKLVKRHNAEAEKSGGKTLQPSICVLEKGAEVGSLGLSGAVMNPRGIQELLGEEWKPEEVPSCTPVKGDAVYYLTEGGGSWKLPVTPPTLHNHGNYIVSLAQLCRWLAPKVQAEGVDLFEGMPAALPLYEGEGRASKVVGVQCRDQGIGKDGKAKGNFQAGANITAKVTVLAEGPRGSIAKYLIPRLGLDEGRNPQTYGTGVKEIWKLKEGTPDRTGQVIHTMGFPFAGAKRKHFGGGWIYFGKDRLVSIGFVTYLDYDDPYLDPHREFQKLKTHPFVKEILDGAEIQDYGAKTFAGGGYWAIPQLYADGVLLTGDTAGFVNTMNLKGIQYAVKSGMLAAETALDALKAEDYSAKTLAKYQERIEGSYIREDLWKARNFHQSFQDGDVMKGGLFWGMVKTGTHMVLGGRGYKARLRAKPDYQHYHPVNELYGKAEPKPEERGDIKFDNKYTFDKVTDIFQSGTTHLEDQPAHLLVRDPSICVDRCTKEYQNPCLRFCPAAVYEMHVDEATKKQKLQLNFSNCVHCKTCDIKDPYGIIDWVPPEGGGGPKYKLT